ncbi:MAG TPA: MBL fold metallo-hydrolase RNA specificity domain-containing protein, partial [Sphingomonadales bacterium]|nr:MBL fold metallo-hydrolase RNA specificity domain-containing protein [Sphingomonadales bacterium]
AALRDGATKVRIFGNFVPVKAEVVTFDMLSAHADAGEIVRWLSAFAAPPRVLFIVHGEPDASSALKTQIEGALGWRCMIPKHGQSIALD